MAHNHMQPHAQGHGHTHSHNHTHDHGGNGNIAAAFFLNLSFTVIELVGGIFTNSVAIVSDAVHDLGDSVSLGLAWYFQKLSKKGSTKQYSYGYKRFALLGAIINAVFLSAGSVYILSEAIPRLFTPQATDATGMFFLAVIGIAINGAAVLRTRKATSINERVVSLHLLEDVLGWAAVLVGSVVIRLTGLTVIDPILSVGIAGFVLLNVYKNIRQLLPVLLQGAPTDIDSGRIIEMLREIRQIGDVHHLHLWSLDESYHILTAHVVLAEAPNPAAMVALKRDIRATLSAEGIHHVTIEFEAPDEPCAFEHCM